MRIQTEIGLLPEDWKVATIGEVFSLPTDSIRVSRIKLPDYVSTENLLQNKAGVVKYTDPLEYSYVREYKVGDTLMSNIRPYLKKIWLSDRRGGCSTDVLVFRPRNIDPVYGYYVLADDRIFRLSMETSIGTKMPRGDKSAIISFPVAIPSSTTEQERIAAALTSIDSLIDNLERTIQKKKNIREGAMEELLSGKRRLPGFSGEWVEKSLDDLVKVKKGQQKNASELLDKGPYPVINGGQTASGYTTEYNTEEDTVTISEGGNSCGFVNYIRQRFWSGGHCYALYVKDKNLDNTFLYFMLKAGEKDIMSLRVGSGLPNIQTKQLLELLFYLPSDIHEQHAIADTLTALDDEIALLQAERDKYQQIRSGMMDDLLTGKIRLV